MIFDIAPINVNLQLKESHIVLEAQFAELDTVEMESLSLISMNHVTMPTIWVTMVVQQPVLLNKAFPAPESQTNDPSVWRLVAMAFETQERNVISKIPKRN